MRDTGQTWRDFPVYTTDDDTAIYTVLNIGTKAEPRAAILLGRNHMRNFPQELDNDHIAMEYLIDQVLSGNSQPLNEAAEEEVRREQENQ